MTDPHSCPLCTESYDDRNDLRVHLEVEHRKSEVVSQLVELDAAGTDLSSGREPAAADDELPAPSAD
ncbi:C2H2-type zinc finger protein [Natrinema versiforme]|uniref:C2H2-type domain-containing protein n=1 Tax=Natrinema versiforme TaxID=88724 RepID=A0A4P8WH15_9EURY|nr:C2H2-type zinc finger protein [Natrinema versiforme]QCS42302.1 hypothetical protein FEJ81_07995 [Natrinema versiforme]